MTVLLFRAIEEVRGRPRDGERGAPSWRERWGSRATRRRLALPQLFDGALLEEQMTRSSSSMAAQTRRIPCRCRAALPRSAAARARRSRNSIDRQHTRDPLRGNLIRGSGARALAGARRKSRKRGPNSIRAHRASTTDAQRRSLRGATRARATRASDAERAPPPGFKVGSRERLARRSGEKTTCARRMRAVSIPRAAPDRPASGRPSQRDPKADFGQRSIRPQLNAARFQILRSLRAQYKQDARIL